MAESLATVAASIRTAQSIAHHRFYELGDTTHAGSPRECSRPVCVRLLSDALVVEQAERALAHHLNARDDPCEDRGVDWPCDVADALGAR